MNLCSAMISNAMTVANNQVALMVFLALGAASEFVTIATRVEGSLTILGIGFNHVSIAIKSFAKFV